LQVAKVAKVIAIPSSSSKQITPIQITHIAKPRNMVKLTIKTVQNKVFNVEAGENDSIADVKIKIKDAQGFAVEAQKIIYAGEPDHCFSRSFCCQLTYALVDWGRREGIGGCDNGGAT
jgi:hypothetical protein